MLNEQQIEHLAFSFLHGGFYPFGQGGCSCDDCDALREKIRQIARQEAEDYGQMRRDFQVLVRTK